MEKYVSPELEYLNGVKPSEMEERERERERERGEHGWKGNGDIVLGLEAIHLDFLQECRTINAEYYSKILLGEAKDKIRFKRKTGGNRISFLQDSARPHTARKTMETIKKLKSQHKNIQ